MIPGHNLFIQIALKYGFSLFGIPKTGQTTSYEANDDGDYERGYPKAGARFVNNGDGTITDLATGLMWVADPTAAGIGSGYHWDDAISNCEALNYAGHSDWRMPNIKELQTIVDYSEQQPSIDTDYFTSGTSYYWSSTTDITNTAQALAITFYSGLLTSGHKGSSFNVRPVRLGV